MQPAVSQADVAKEFDAYRETYAQTVNESLVVPGLDVDFFTRVKADYLIDIITREIGDPKTARVLDIGCGVGVYHQNLRPRVGSLSGVDVSVQSIDMAKTHNDGVDYSHYAGARLPYDDGSFDVAMTVCVMHHVPVPMWENFASEMARILRPGGMAVVFEHNPRNPLTMRIVNRCPFDADAVLLKPAKTKSLLSGAGFDAVRARHILSVPPAGKALRLIDGLFSPLHLGAQYYALGKKPQ